MSLIQPFITESAEDVSQLLDVLLALSRSHTQECAECSHRTLEAHSAAAAPLVLPSVGEEFEKPLAPTAHLRITLFEGKRAGTPAESRDAFVQVKAAGPGQEIAVLILMLLVQYRSQLEQSLQTLMPEVLDTAAALRDATPPTSTKH